MNILILAVVLFFIGILFIFFFFFAGKKKSKKNKPGVLPGAKELVEGKKEAEAENILNKYRKANEECEKLRIEVDSIKDKELAVRQELERVNIWIEKDKNLQDDARKEIFNLKEKIIKKDDDYERQFSLNLTLRKELNENKDKQAELEIKLREGEEKIKALETQNRGIREESLRQVEVIESYRKKDDETEWVSKKEYDMLKARLEKIMEADEK